MKAIVLNLYSKLPTSWKGYITSAVGGYLASHYGVAGREAFKCFRAVAGF